MKTVFYIFASSKLLLKGTLWIKWFFYYHSVGDKISSEESWVHVPQGARQLLFHTKAETIYRRYKTPWASCGSQTGLCRSRALMSLLTWVYFGWWTWKHLLASGLQTDHSSQVLNKRKHKHDKRFLSTEIYCIRSARWNMIRQSNVPAAD